MRKNELLKKGTAFILTIMMMLCVGGEAAITAFAAAPTAAALAMEEPATDNTLEPEDTALPADGDVAPDEETVGTQAEGPANLRFTTSGSNIVVDWDTVSSATGYDITLTPKTSGAPVASATNLALTSYTFTAAVASTVYEVSVKATLSGGEKTDSSTTVAFLPLANPQGIAVAKNGSVDKSATFTWNNNTNANAYGVRIDNAATEEVVNAPLYTHTFPSASANSVFAFSAGTTGTDGKFYKRSTETDIIRVYAPLADVQGFKVSKYGNKAKLEWKAVPGADAYTLYIAQADLDADGQSPATDISGSYVSASVSPTVSGDTCSVIVPVDNNQYYSFKLRAEHTRVGGTESQYFQFGTITAPLPLVSTSATLDGAVAFSTGTNSIRVEWSHVSGADSYSIYRSTKENGVYVPVGYNSASEVCAFEDKGLTCNATYWYIVYAAKTVDGKRTYVAQSNPVSAKPQVPVPSGFKVEKHGYNAIRLQWNATEGASGYHLFRAPADTGVFRRIASVDGKSTAYVDSGLNDGEYLYRMYALTTVSNKQIYSEYTATKNIRPMLLDAPETISFTNDGLNSIIVNWDKVNDADGYNIYVKTPTAKEKRIGTTKSSSARSYVHALADYDTYTYRIAPWITVGKSTIEGKSISASTSPNSLPAPADFTATALTEYGAKLTWGNVIGAAGYYIYRATDASGPYKIVATVKSGSTTSYTNTEVPYGTYYYKVSAYHVLNGKNLACKPTSAKMVDIHGLAKPTGFTANTSEYASVELNWDAVEKASGYYVYRSDKVDANSHALPH